MKAKSLIIAVVAGALVAFGVGAVIKVRFMESGSYWDPSTKQLHSDKVGRLEATGEDLRIYEFTPQSAPKKQCIFVAGTNKGSVTCFDK